VSGSDPIQVVFAADGNYAMPLAVAICSVAANCDSRRQLVFTVIQRGIVPDLQEKVEHSLQRTGFPNARIDWMEAKEELVSNLRIVHRYLTSVIYARLLLPDLLPVEVDKALYLDSDIVVREDLAELWDTDIGERSVFAARDRIGVVSALGGLVNYQELGIPAEAKYFNSGVLLLNLKKWRESSTGQHILKYLRTHQEILQMGDQDGLNAVLFDDWGELEFRWNWQIIPRMHRQGEMNCWAPESDRKSIVHFITSEKPWLPGCEYEERRFFFEYLEKTEWAGWRIPFTKEIYVRLKRVLRKAQHSLIQFLTILGNPGKGRRRARE
jgi:lipopolysaccharide biosynthesis glycosyltransferase